jgi:hypothetical protein
VQWRSSLEGALRAELPAVAGLLPLLPYSRHLGSASGDAGLNTPHQKAAVSLLRDNLKFGSMPVQPLGSTTVFHAGTIGAGPRLAAASSPVTEEEAEENRRDVAGLVLRLCEGVGEERGGAGRAGRSGESRPPGTSGPTRTTTPSASASTAALASGGVGRGPRLPY